MLPPAVTAAQMAVVDRRMVDELGIALLQMMELAGRGLAELARRRLGGSLVGRRVVVFCGPGHNGGGGMVAARHLANWGALVSAHLAVPAARLRPTPRAHWRTLQALDLAAPEGRPTPRAVDLIVDALLGYGSAGDPRGPLVDSIRAIERAGAPLLALDTPSGLDVDSGRAGDPCVRAQATLTLALPKPGLLQPQARPWVGELWLADIGVPPSLWAAIGLEVPPLFERAPLLRMTTETPDALRS